MTRENGNPQLLEQASGAAVALSDAQATAKPKGDPLQDLLEKPIRPIVNVEQGRLVPANFEGMQRIAKWLLETQMLPGWVKNLAQATMVVSICCSLGLDVVQNARFVMVVNGVPSLWGDAVVAKVRSSGLCAGIREWYTGDKDSWTAHVEAKRFIKRPDGSYTEEVVTHSFSWAQARQAGLVDKEMWKKYPHRMLLGKPRSYALRALFADVLCGIDVYEDVYGSDGRGEKAAALDAKVQALDAAAVENGSSRGIEWVEPAARQTEEAAASTP